MLEMDRRSPRDVNEFWAEIPSDCKHAHRMEKQIKASAVKVIGKAIESLDNIFATEVEST